jgi:hypothetical protein
MTSDDAVTEDGLRIVVGSARGDEGIDLDEGARVDEELDSFAGGQLPARMLRVDTKTAPAFESASPHCLESFDPLIVRRHRVSNRPSLRKDRVGERIIRGPRREKSAPEISTKMVNNSPELWITLLLAHRWTE